MDAPVDLFTQQARNRSRSRWVVLGFIVFFAWLGFGGDWIAMAYTAGAEPEQYRHVVPWFGIALTLVAGGMAAWAWRRGPGSVLWSTSAREVVTPATDAERRFVNVVEEMCVASGLPRPRTWIVPDEDPNAFATGHDERQAHIAVTQGLLDTLTREELQAVIGHEMGHVRNLDVRLMTLLAALVGTVTLLGDGMWRMMRGTGRMRMAGSRGGKKGGNPLLLVALVLWVVSWLLAPLILRLLALSVSREREYLADAMSAQFTRNPLALASALGRIESAAGPTRAIKRGSAHLCIADPLGRVAAASRWGASHPPMAQRIARLEAMAHASSVTREA
ncbi:MAG: M48 family metalloprotease [Gemmatimonadaceae bacterium]|nr:M48 family metalloprotease [Gemmatimonadaceae bacterium]